MNNIELRVIYVIYVPESWIDDKNVDKEDYLNKLKEGFFLGDSRVDTSKVQIRPYASKGVQVVREINFYEKQVNKSLLKPISANTQWNALYSYYIRIGGIVCEDNDEMLKHLGDAVLQLKDFIGNFSLSSDEESLSQNFTRHKMLGI